MQCWELFRFRILPLVFLGFLLLSACSTVPMSVDPSTLVAYNEIVEEQKQSSSNPCIGIYRVTFVSHEITSDKATATPANGDWRVACVLNGKYLEIVSLSGLKGFGAMSDQGNSFSVNFQGAALWRFERSSFSGDTKAWIATDGYWTGITDSNPYAVSMAFEDTTLIIHSVEKQDVPKAPGDLRKNTWFMKLTRN